MLDDRPYMRGTGFDNQRPAAVIIIIVNAVFFLASLFISEAFKTEYLALSLSGIRHWYLWQFLSFQFLHAGPIHLLLNSWGIYVFGRAVEDAIGRSRFLQVYFISGALGGLLHVAGSAVWPNHFGQNVIGASAGLFGLIAAYGALFPEQRLTLLLFFILPVTLTARVLLISSAFLAVCGLLMVNDNIAHGAHLGGLVAGLAYIHWIVRSDWTWLRWRWRAFRTERPRELVSTSSSRASWPRSTPPAEEVPSAEFISREVDPILDKISAHGIQSLTDRDRKILEAARAKMAKR
jgi:membrane associated rhomboid family serine protease